jgi:hypothetical protein
LIVEGLFLERMSHRQVMPELRAEAAAVPFTEAFEGASEA